MNSPREVRSGVTLEEIIGWGGPEVFNQALGIVNSGDVADIAYDDDKVEITGRFRVRDDHWMPVRMHLEPGGRVRSYCTCPRNQRYGQICEHVVAVGIALAQLEREEIEPEEPEDVAGGDGTPAGPEPDYIEVQVAPKFYAYVRGSRASLSVELDAYYGDVDFPACSFQPERTVWLEDPDDPLVRRTRSMKAEREALKLLERYGFTPGYQTGDVKYYLTDPWRVLNFLGSGLPCLRRRWERVDLADDLGDLVDRLPTVAPMVTVRDVEGGAFDVNYSFTAICEGGSVEVSPVEIQAAINRGDGFIMHEGAPVLLDNEAIDTMHGVFRDCATTQGGAPAGWFRVRGIHAPYVRSSLDDLGIEYDDNAARNWRESALSGNRAGGAAKFEPVSLGELDGVLRPYQKQGVYWMRFLENAGLSGLLADEMGLGKTLQTLTWLSLPRSAEGEKLPAIVVCPTSLVRNWEAEARKFVPAMKTLVLSGPDRAADFPKIPGADLVVTSYALLQRDFDDAYAGVRFSVAVLDEAQHIKNRRTRNAQTAKRIESRRRLVLTGTPVENSVADVWSIFDFLLPGYLGDYEPFKAGYELPIAEGGNAADLAQERLRRKLRPFILRRLKKSVAKDLPDKLVKVSLCPMGEETQREYNRALELGRPGAKTKFQMLALLMKLRQIASHGKVEALMEQLDEAIDGGHRVLVFSQFVRQLAVLRGELEKAGIAYCYLDGSTKDRLGECNRFNRSPDIPVFLISLMAGGTGLNLTGADMVIHYDPWWNPAVEDQATDRAHRIGQKKKVYVVKLIAADSVEEKVLALQRRKQAVIAATVSSSDEAIAERLTEADLRELLS